MILEKEKIKFKKITEDEFNIYLRRLIRFKYPPDKRQRVFCQILTNHSIEPKISKKIFEMLTPANVDELVSFIWNESLGSIGEFRLDFFENEVRCFNSKKMLEDILGEIFPDVYDEINVNKILENRGYEPVFVRNYDEVYIALQKQFFLNFGGSKFSKIKKVLLVEGATEEILLPKFAKLCDFDFDKNGIFLVASGGKNQVVKDYLAYKGNLNLPVSIVLDNDAKEQYDSISSILREQDDIFLIEEGEFEDLLDENLILKALNQEFKNTAQFSIEDLNGEAPMCYKLYELYKNKGLGEFKKVEFAKMIFSFLNHSSNLGSKIYNIINFIKK